MSLFEQEGRGQRGVAIPIGQGRHTRTPLVEEFSPLAEFDLRPNSVQWPESDRRLTTTLGAGMVTKDILHDLHQGSSPQS